jgi:N-acetyl-gamma-glutamyl-phosphate/LysW-gamma-L-alpha-aminoadipyl-6-phosphate reductase
MRSFAPTGHRHTAEVLQALALKNVVTDVHLSATAVDNVRGVLATAHVFVKPGTQEKDVWKAFRETYGSEPFVRIVKEKTTLPLPPSRRSSRAVTTPTSDSNSIQRRTASPACARSHLMKGAAGTAPQCANVMMGWDETLARVSGLHPILSP